MKPLSLFEWADIHESRRMWRAARGYGKLAKFRRYALTVARLLKA